MATVTIDKVGKDEERTLPVFAEMERAFDRVRERAFALFEGRRFGDARALDDWLTAEREVCWPQSELVERDRDFVVSVALPGFEPGEIRVTVTPQELIVHAESRSAKSDRREVAAAKLWWTEFSSRDTYRKVEFPAEIDTGQVNATLKNGLLEIVAGKVGKKAEQPVAVPTAA